MYGDARGPGFPTGAPFPGPAMPTGRTTARPGPLDRVAAATAVVAAVLAVVGGLLPISETRPSGIGGALSGRTGWASYNGALPPRFVLAVPLEGLLPTVAAVLLLVGAVLVVTGRNRSVAVVGATLLAGSVASVFVHLLPNKANLERPLPSVTGTGSLGRPTAIVDIGSGTWLLLVAGILGLLVLVLLSVAGRAPRPAAYPAAWPPPHPGGPPPYGPPPYGGPPPGQAPPFPPPGPPSGRPGP